MKIGIKKVNSFQIIILGFLLIIIFGALLLTLPISTKDREGATFADAFFTSTSATCVTGLIVHDTATYWSLFGQTVILLLIQIGGLGVMTIAAAFAVISGRRIGLIQRSAMQESISAPQVGGIVKLTIFTIKATFLTELAGAAIMTPVFCKEFGMLKGVWYSVFHSISAFCNAGFDLMGVKEQYSSLMYFKASPIVNIVIMLLIIFGGIGFLTWDDIRTNKHHLKKYRMQSKVILTVTTILIVVPALYNYIFEFSDAKWNMTVGERILISLFQAVSPRTAGFNTADLTMLSGGGKLIMIFLMLIGGSPGSTAGGMKTTTFAVLVASAISVFRRKKDTAFYGRSVPPDVVKHASAIFMMYLSLFSFSAVIISGIEKLPISVCLFETASAVGTVGLSMGVTPELGAVSQIILAILMFFGRVGGLTLIYAAISGGNSNVSRMPQERITVG